MAKKSTKPMVANYEQGNALDIERYINILFAMDPGQEAQEVKFDEAAQRVFFTSLLESGNIGVACERAGISRSTYHHYRKLKPKFRAMLNEVVHASIDRLEQEAFRRAYTGTTKPIFQGGRHVGNVQEYSDTLLTTLLKAHLPKYQKIDLEAEDSSGTYKVINVSKLPTHLLEELEKYINEDDSNIYSPDTDNTCPNVKGQKSNLL